MCFHQHGHICALQGLAFVKFHVTFGAGESVFTSMGTLVLFKVSIFIEFLVTFGAGEWVFESLGRFVLFQVCFLGKILATFKAGECFHQHRHICAI